MHAKRFDTVAKLFADRRFSRRQALSQGGAGLAAAGLAATSAQDATPEPVAPDAAHGPEMLFVQSFQSGSIAPTEGADGRYTVTLEHGLGQTIYFSDRPDRIVGATPTDRFLAGLGFPADNPPNAALVVETAPGETDIAVVELFNPVFDPADPSVTYDVAVLANWTDSVELGFTAAPTDLAALAPAFGAAHLFIDDCSSGRVICVTEEPADNGAFDTDYCYSWWTVECLPCSPWITDYTDRIAYWTRACNEEFPELCGDHCTPWFV